MDEWKRSDANAYLFVSSVHISLLAFCSLSSISQTPVVCVDAILMRRARDSGRRSQIGIGRAQQKECGTNFFFSFSAWGCATRIARNTMKWFLPWVWWVWWVRVREDGGKHEEVWGTVARPVTLILFQSNWCTGHTIPGCRGGSGACLAGAVQSRLSRTEGWGMPWGAGGCYIMKVYLESDSLTNCFVELNRFSCAFWRRGESYRHQPV